MTDSTSNNSPVWKKQASQWLKIGSPLRPVEKDGELMLKCLSPLLDTASKLNIVMLGVTPEVVNLAWPNNVSLKAYDQSTHMIETVWNPNVNIKCSIEEAKWQAIPLEKNLIDAVVGDGVLTVLSSMNDYMEVLSEMLRVLKPDSLLVLRCFVNEEKQETPKEVQKEFSLGKIHNFHVLKWRLAMSVSTNATFGTKVSDIYEQFNLYFPDRLEVARHLQCGIDVINTIDAYKGSTEYYTFPSLSKLLNILEPMFTVINIEYGDYELAHRCPTICCKPR